MRAVDTTECATAHRTAHTTLAAFPRVTCLALVYASLSPSPRVDPTSPTLLSPPLP